MNGECLLNCGTGTCASGQSCITIGNAVCSDAVFKDPHRCSTAKSANKNCIVDCEAGAGDEAATAHMCYQASNCAYETNATASLPQKLGELYPAYVPKEWNGPGGCVDSYVGEHLNPYCLGEVLFEKLKLNPGNVKSQSDPDAIETTLGAITDTFRRMGQSEKGFYCLPRDAQGWRYTVFPIDPFDTKTQQCTVADCMVHALSAPSVATVFYDWHSKACLASTCEGPGCSNLSQTCVGDACPPKEGGRRGLQTDAGAPVCEGSVSNLKQTCEDATKLTCGGYPEDQMQLWTKDSDVIKIYATSKCAKGFFDSGRPIWADSPDADHDWQWPSQPGVDNPSWVEKKTAFEWWKKGLGTQMRVNHWYADRDLAKLTLREPPGHGLNELFFHANGCAQFSGDCSSSQENCNACEGCGGSRLPDGECTGYGTSPQPCPSGFEICEPLANCQDLRG